MLAKLCQLLVCEQRQCHCDRCCFALHPPHPPSCSHSRLSLMSRFGLSHVFHKPLDALNSLPEWAAVASFASHPVHGCYVQTTSLADFVQNIRQSSSGAPSLSPFADRAGVSPCEQPDLQPGSRSEQQLSCPQPHSAQQTRDWRHSSWRWHLSRWISAAKLSAGTAASRACHTSTARCCTPVGCVPSSPSLSRVGWPAASSPVRHHSSQAARAAGHCWRCQAALQSGAVFFCLGCGAIQPAAPGLSFYTVMGLCALGLLLVLLLSSSSTDAAGEQKLRVHGLALP